MATNENPISRVELRQELQTMLQHYATKADLANLRAELRAMELRSVGYLITVVGIGVAVLKLWE